MTWSTGQRFRIAILRLLIVGDLKPVWKSLPIPTKQEGPVQVLVADNFEAEAFKSKIDRDIVFYVYAPWLVINTTQLVQIQM